MNALKMLVNAALQRKFTVSVWDGEEWQVKRSVIRQEIYSAVDSVDEAQLRFRDSDGKVVGWALIVNGLDDDELVADYTDNEWMNKAMGSVA